MRPAAVYPTNPFFGRDRVWSMRRGGIDAARRNGAALPVAGAVWCLSCIVGRDLDLRPKSRRCAAVDLRNAPAGADPAAPMILKKCNVRGGRKRPPYKPAYMVVFPGNPAWGAPLPGGIYASPTNTRDRVYDTGDEWRRKVYGPHACGPYEPPGKDR